MRPGSGTFCNPKHWCPEQQGGEWPSGPSTPSPPHPVQVCPPLSPHQDGIKLAVPALCFAEQLQVGLDCPAGGLCALNPREGPVSRAQLPLLQMGCRAGGGADSGGSPPRSASGEGVPVPVWGPSVGQDLGSATQDKHCALLCQKRPPLAAPPFPVPSENQETGHDLLR